MKRYGLLSCALVLLVLSGCASINKLGNHDDALLHDKDLAKHVISIDPDGKLKSIGCNGNACSQDEYLNNIISGIEGFKKERGGKETEVVLFIHGGLNDPVESIERSFKNYPLIKASGKYPIFVIWNSSGPSSYRDHLFKIRQGNESKTARFSSPIYFLTDVGNSIVNAPKSWIITGEHMLDSIDEKDNIDKKLNNEICYLIGEKFNVSYAGKPDLPSNLSRNARWILSSPIKAITTPFAYTMPKPAWDIMLRRTNTLFYTPSDLKEQACKEDKEKSNIKKGVPKVFEPGKPGSGALYTFLEKLTPLKDGIKITLVGHSMGAIIVNKIVLLEPKLPYKNIVHLASADSVNNVFNIIVPYINYAIQNKQDECPMLPKDSQECKDWAKGQAVQFYSLMLHPDNENREEAWGGMVPSGSLLTWIDEMYTSPETVLDRRSGRWDNIKRAIPYLSDKVKRNMHFKIFGINESEECKKNDTDCLITEPQEHGDFDALAFWQEKTWWK